MRTIVKNVFWLSATLTLAAAFAASAEAQDKQEAKPGGEAGAEKAQGGMGQMKDGQKGMT